MTSVRTTGPDIYGQSHPVETPELLEAALRKFRAEVDRIPAKDKPALLRAQDACPGLLTDDFMLMFLRCDMFTVEVPTYSLRRL
jgi:hypothetical protein